MVTSELRARRVLSYAGRDLIFVMLSDVSPDASKTIDRDRFLELRDKKEVHAHLLPN